MSKEHKAAGSHMCTPDADRLIECIGNGTNNIRFLTFWSLEEAYPFRKLRYHLGQLGMLRLMNELADRSCAVDALICDSQSRTIVGGSAGDLDRDISVTDSFIRCLKNKPVRVNRMSGLVELMHGKGDASHHVARCVVNGALSFRNFIQKQPPGTAVLDRLDRFRSCVELPELDNETASYVSKLNDEFPRARPIDLLAALYASVRRPKWFDAFWLGDIAAWVSMQAQSPNTVILEADRSAYSWLTHRCFLDIGTSGEGDQGNGTPWPDMYFVSPILGIDGKEAMQLSARSNAIFLHHTAEGLKDRLARASTDSLASYRQWLLKQSSSEMTDEQLREALYSQIELMRQPIPPDLFVRTKAAAPKTSSLPDNVRIGLCLSGGGFRATFFHLGLVKLLRDLDLLKKVVGVYSVSGGSILAANLAKHWTNYIKDQEDRTFFEAMDPLRKLSQADIRGRIVRRWFWFGARVDLLARYYDSIGGLAATELKDLPQVPEFSFLGTSMKTGNLAAFTRKGYHNGNRQFTSPDMSLARAVAASSAFPPLFPPMWVSERDLVVDPDGKEGIGPVADGGVYDNLGLTKLRADAEARSDERWCTVTLVSDASAPFGVSGSDKFKSMFDRTARATNILMKRVGDLEAADQSAPNEADDEWMQMYPIEVKIDCIIEEELIQKSFETVGDYCVQDDRVQALTSEIRTDLDCFSNVEVTSLMRHGYEVGLASLTKAGLVPRDFRPRDPCGVPFPRLDTFNSVPLVSPVTNRIASLKHIRGRLERSRVRRLGIFHASDWLCWAVPGSLVVLALVYGFS